jgi:hypothetical protein
MRKSADRRPRYRFARKIRTERLLNSSKRRARDGRPDEDECARRSAGWEPRRSARADVALAVRRRPGHSASGPAARLNDGRDHHRQRHRTIGTA